MMTATRARTEPHGCRASRPSRPGDFGPRAWDDRAYGWAHDPYAAHRDRGAGGSSFRDRGGDDYDDHRTRDFDARAEALQEQRYRRAREYGRGGSHDDDFLPGSYGYGGEYRRDLAGLPGNHAYGYGQASYGSGFEDAALGNAARHSGVGRSGVVDHRGRGPRGYTRSDQRILEDLNERLCDDPLVDASNIDVRCEQGRIVLEGEVDDRRMKHRVEDIADAVSGAREVENRIRVAGRAPWPDAAAHQGTERRPRGEDATGASARGNKAGATGGETTAGSASPSPPQPQQPH